MIAYLRYLPERIVLRLVPLACFLGDLGIVAYCLIKMRTDDYFNKVFTMAANISGLDPDAVDDQTRSDLFNAFKFNLSFSLALIVIFHLIIYVFYMKKRELPRKYILSMTIIASLCLFYLSLCFLFDSSWMWSLFCLVPGILYGKVFLLAKNLKFR